MSFLGCTFAHLGATGLVADGGTQGLLVSNCSFDDVSANGVALGGVALNATGSAADTYLIVEGSVFVRVPAEYHDCAPVWGGFVSHTTTAHNFIANQSNTGIALGRGWNDDFARQRAGIQSLATIVFGSNQLLSDGGSIYMLGLNPGSLCSGNFVSSQRLPLGSIYTDDGSAFWTIEGNVAHVLPSSKGVLWVYIWIKSIHDEMVRGNFADTEDAVNKGTKVAQWKTILLCLAASHGQVVINDAGQHG